MKNLWNALHTGLTHPITTLTGAFSLVCGSGTLLGVIPTAYTAMAMGACGVAVGLGLISAPDANKTTPKP